MKLIKSLIGLLLIPGMIFAFYLYARTDTGGVLFDRWGGGSAIVFSAALTGAMILFSWFGALVHELGHVWGGALADEELIQVRVWRFALTRKPDGFKLGFEKSARPYGWTVSLPTSDANLRSATFRKILLGPLASLALFVPLALASAELWLRTDPTSGGAVTWKLLLSAFALITLAQCILNLLPEKTEHYMNDGYRLLGLIRRDPNVGAGMDIALLWGRLFRSERPRDHDPFVVMRAINTSAEPTQQALANWLAFYWALDRGDVQGAEGFLDRSMALEEEKLVAAFPDMLLDAAYVEALYRSNPTRARSLVAKVDGRDVQPAMRLRAEAAISLAEGDLRGALDKATEGLRILRSGWQTGGKIAEIEWLEAIEARAGAPQ